MHLGQKLNSFGGRPHRGCFDSVPNVFGGESFAVVDEPKLKKPKPKEEEEEKAPFRPGNTPFSRVKIPLDLTV